MIQFSFHVESEFAQKFWTLNWTWANNQKTLELYFKHLYLLWKYRVQLTPDRLADDVLHQHLQQPSFEQDMHLLFGQSIVHQSGVTKNATLTRNLFEQEFGPTESWNAADCNIAFVNA